MLARHGPDLPMDAVAAEAGVTKPVLYRGITGLVQSTGEWWLDRRSMSRAHVIDYVTQLIWWALTGVLRDAGITAGPDTPVPAARPALTLRTGDLAAASRGSR